MNAIVLDSGVLLARSLPDEPLTQQANALLSQWKASDITFIAPRLFRSEIAAVVRKAVFQGRIRFEEGKHYLDEMLQFEI